MRNPRAQWGGSPGGQWVLVVMCSHGLAPPFGRIEAPGEERGDNCWGPECCLGKRLEEGSRKGREDDRPGAQLCTVGCGEGLASGAGASSGGFLSSVASLWTHSLTLFTHGKQTRSAKLGPV